MWSSSASRNGLLCALMALWAVFGVAGEARADYINPRFLGPNPWQPSYFRNDEGLGGLQSAPRGLLRGTAKIRETYEVDLKSGRLTIQRQYGRVLVAPEYVGDIRTTTLAAAARAGRQQWTTLVEQRSLRAQDGGQSSLEIEIPVTLPDAIADVIGQGARLNLSGSENITFSGTSTVISGVPELEGGTGSLFPDLDMRQQLRVNLDGTIGRKIHVLVNHDSEVSTDLENKIQLRYDGDEDEVVQKIEMGNTDLSLPGAEFLSFRKSQQGLFGAKAVGKVGALDLTVIASQQEGETATQTFVGQARQDSTTVQDWQFVKRKYYWVEHPALLTESDPDSLGVLPLQNFTLFLDDFDTRNDNELGARQGFAFVDPETGMPTDSVGVAPGFYHQLEENVDYSIDFDSGTLTLNGILSGDHKLGAIYTWDDGTQRGSATNPDTLFLRLLSPTSTDLYDEAKGFTGVQILEQKNVYNIGALNVNKESFELTIKRRQNQAGQQDEDNQQGTEFVKILGLDYKGVSDLEPDLLVEPEFISSEEGVIRFPNILPFAPDFSVFDLDSLGSAGQAAVNVIVSPDQVSTGRSNSLGVEREGVELEDPNEVIYTDDPDLITNQGKYIIEMKFSTPTPTFSLNRFNIIEGSETVRLNGRILNKGSDYTIDYDFGQLTFLTEEAGRADASIEVDFEFVPLFGQAKESLLGASGTYNFSPDTRLSSSWLFFSRSTPEERPKLGQEPSRILVGNLYGQWVTNPGFMTGLVNSLPLVRTETESEFQVQGETAMSIPNPNTKNEVYIDDMEGVEDSRDLAITRGLWVPASEPVGPTNELDKENVAPLPLAWYNPDNVVRRRDVFTEQAEEQEGQDFIQVLEMRAKNESVPGDTGWFGVMRNLSRNGEDFSEKKFLEIWVNDFGQYVPTTSGGGGEGGGKLVFDMGAISEDFYVESANPMRGRGIFDTEDNDFDGELTSSTEDFGLDFVEGVDGAGVALDDGDDDFDFSRSDPDSIKYEKINGWEGNSRLDTEDLDGDRVLSTDNNYLSYVIDLSNVEVGTPGGPVIFNNDVEPGNFWRLYRILLDDGELVGGIPRRRAIKYARLWADGLESGPGPKLQVASIKILGSTWRERQQALLDDGTPVEEGFEDGAFAVNVLNNKESLVYCEPFDPGEEGNEPRREQSLTMIYEDIPSGARQDSSDTGFPNGAGREVSAFRDILDLGQGVNQDFTQYADMSFYLRDGAYDASGSLRPGLEPSEGTFFFRFGPDTTNFYEFSTADIPGGGGECIWREVDLNLNDLAELKLEPPDGTRVVEGVPVEYRFRVVNNDTLAVYGAPTLSRVRRLTLGVRGDDPDLPEISGELWVNEIRLNSVRKDVGYAARLSASGRFADFLNVDGSVRQVDSEFRRIEGDRTGTNQESWSVRGDMKLNKFFDGLGVSLPLIAEVSSSESVPRLSPNSDIVLEDEQDKERAKSTNRRRSISTRFTKTKPSRSPFLRYTIDNLSLSAKNDKTDTRSPFQVTDSKLTSGSASYNLNPGQGASLRLVGFDLSYLPSLRANLNGSLNETQAYDIEEDEEGDVLEVARDPVRTRALEGTFGVQWDPLRSNSFDSKFSFNKRQDFDRKKDQSLLESVKSGSRELSRDQSTRVSWRPSNSYLRWLRPVLTYDTSYNEDGSPGVQPADLASIPDDEGGPVRVLTVSNSATREVSGTLNLRQIFRKSNEPSGGRASGTRGARPGRGRPGSDGDRTQGQDEAEDEEETESEEEGGGLGFGSLKSGFVDVMNMFGDLRYTYTDRRSSRFSRVSGRPSLGYQFGIWAFDERQLVPSTSGATNTAQRNRDFDYSQKFDTSFQPTSDVYFDTSWNWRVNKRFSTGIPTKTEDLTFPDVSLNVEGLQRTRLLNRWADNSSVNSSYRRTTRRSGQLARPGETPNGAEWYDDESVQTEFSPLLGWNVTWKSKLNTTLTHNRSKTVDDRLNIGDELIRNESRTSSYRFNARYSFSAPRGINLLGRRLRFSSDLTLSLDVERSVSRSETQRFVDGIFQTSGSSIGTDRKSLSVKPRASYNFSRTVNGALDISFTRNQDLKSGRRETVVMVGLNALIKF